MTDPKENLVIDISIDDEGWQSELPDAETIARRAINAAWALIDEKGQTAEGPVEVSLVLVNDARQQMMNRDYRGRDKPTNVLSFPGGPGPGERLPTGAPRLLGDIAIALETTKREALAEEKTMANHFCHLVVHGMLHLAGFDHEDDADAGRMEKLEADILDGLGIADPYGTGETE